MNGTLLECVGLLVVQFSKAIANSISILAIIIILKKHRSILKVGPVFVGWVKSNVEDF